MGNRSENINILVNAKDKTKGVLGNVQKQIIGIGAAYLGWRAVSGIIQGIVDVGIKHEQVWNDVAAALKRHDKEVENNLESIKVFADEMQTLSGESDETIGKMVQGFLDYGQSVSEAMDTTRVAMDLAAGSGLSLKSATDLLSKAAVGYTSTLSRYGIIIDESIPKQEKFAAAIGQINDRFGGAAAARANTMAVKMGLVSEKIGDLGEELFKLFAPAMLSGLNTAISVISGVIGLFTLEVDETATETEKVTKRFESWASETDRLMGLLQDGNITLENFNTAIENIGKVQGELAIPREYVDLVLDYADALGDAADATHVYIPALKQMNDELRKLRTEEAFERKKQEALALAAIMETKLRLERETADLRLRIMSEGYDDIEDESNKHAQSLTKGFLEHHRKWQVEWRDHLDVLANIEQLSFEASLIGLNEYQVAVLEAEREHTQELQRLNRDKLLSPEQLEEAKGALAKLLANNKEMLKDMSMVARAFANAATGAIDGAIDNIVGSLEFLRTESTGVFKNMAADFSRFFIEEVLEQVAKVLVVKLLKLLAGIFDTPANDRMAMTQGSHFAQFFTRGMVDTFQSRGFASSLSAAAPAAIPAAVPGMAPFSGGETHIHFHGPVSNEQYVNDEIVPQVERAVESGRSRLALQTTNLTGRAEIG